MVNEDSTTGCPVSFVRYFSSVALGKRNTRYRRTLMLPSLPGDLHRSQLLSPTKDGVLAYLQDGSDLFNCVSPLIGHVLPQAANSLWP